MSDSIVTKGGRFIDFKNVNVMKTQKKKVDRNVSDERKLKRPENYMWCLTPGCTLCWRGNAIKDTTGSTF